MSRTCRHNSEAAQPNPRNRGILPLRERRSRRHAAAAVFRALSLLRNGECVATPATLLQRTISGIAPGVSRRPSP
jgi:hypothetical protein